MNSWQKSPFSLSCFKQKKTNEGIAEFFNPSINLRSKNEKNLLMWNNFLAKKIKHKIPQLKIEKYQGKLTHKTFNINVPFLSVVSVYHCLTVLCSITYQKAHLKTIRWLSQASRIGWTREITKASFLFPPDDSLRSQKSINYKEPKIHYTPGSRLWANEPI